MHVMELILVRARPYDDCRDLFNLSGIGWRRSEVCARSSARKPWTSTTPPKPGKEPCEPLQQKVSFEPFCRAGWALWIGWMRPASSKFPFWGWPPLWSLCGRETPQQNQVDLETLSSRFTSSSKVLAVQRHCHQRQTTEHQRPRFQHPSRQRQHQSTLC